jgi:hypothetical protein
MTTIINHRHLLSFTRAMKANTEKNEDDGFVPLSSCLKKMGGGGGGEDDDNQIVIVFFHS